jgi:uncharacterized protein (DUF1800 family)
MAETPAWLRRLGAVSSGAAPQLDQLPSLLGSPPPLGEAPTLAVPRRKGVEFTPAQRKALRQKRVKSAETIQEAWIERMAFGPTPIVDRFTQLWLGVFPVSWRQIPDPRMLWTQVQSIRENQGKRYQDLLRAMVLDPAVQISLDGFKSERRTPNENLARELLELFSVGEGNFSEADVQEAARALSGYRLGADGRTELQLRHHDDGQKAVLGVRGRFDAAELVNLLSAQETTALTISRRLWSHLVGPLPSEQRSRDLARDWMRTGLDLPWLYRTLLDSPEAKRSMAMGGMIRDPIDLVVASLHLLGSRHPDALRAARLHLFRMGQVPFFPPNVKGWPVNIGWLNLRTFTARRRGLQTLLGDEEVWESRRIGAVLPEALVPRPPLSFDLPSPADRSHLAALWNDPVWQLK